MRTKLRHTLLLGFGVAVFACVLARPLSTTMCNPPGPRTAQEVADMAQRFGLYLVTDGTTGGRVILSELPLTREQAAVMWLHTPHHPRWIGTVAVYTGWRGMMDNYDPACSAVWGAFFVYGDTALIARLIDAAP